MTTPATRRARGHYSPFICTRCRARKIKCVLPPSVTCPSSASLPQTIDQACQRCRQNGLDCIVESTVLGRPAQRTGRSPQASMRVETVGEAQGQGSAEVSSSPYTGEYLLSKPYEKAREKDQRIPASEVCEALSTPLRFLAVLLGRHPTFARRLPIPQPLSTDLDIASSVPLGLLEQLDTRLVWHNLYYPYIPSLLTLRDRLQIKPAPISSTALFALLCALALDTDSTLRKQNDRLRIRCQQTLFHYGSAVLINPPAHRDTVTLLQLLAEYRPLALCTSHLAASHSLTDSSYYVLAKRAATVIGLDRSFTYLAKASDQPVTPEMVMETIQWLQLVMAEGYAGFVMGKSDIRPDWLASIEPTIDRLEGLLLNEDKVPRTARWRVMQLIIAIRSTRTRVDMFKGWRDLSALQSIIELHQTNGVIFRTAVTALLAGDPAEPELTSTILTLLDAELHKQHLSIKMTAMFFAVMAASHFREHAQFDPSEITQMTDHIERHIKSPPEIDQVSRFMMINGHSTADEIEKQLTDFVHLCENLHLDGVPFIPPTKTAASEVLHSAYHLVQQNAARLKGWGGFHDRVDTHLIIMKECSRRLESESLANSLSVSDGGVMAGAGSLVLDLYGIMSTWKKRWNQDATAIFSPPLQVGNATTGSNTAAPSGDRDLLSHDQTPIINARTAEGPPGQGSRSWADDFFTSWNLWPQPEDIDFSQFIDFDYDPSAPTR